MITLNGIFTLTYDCPCGQVMSYEMLTHCYDWLCQVIDRKGNHIITLAVQAHNGEQREPHNSKLKTNRKREDISATNRSVLSFCRYRGLGLAHIAFVQTNAMLALCSKYKFSAKDITVFPFLFIFPLSFHRQRRAHHDSVMCSKHPPHRIFSQTIPRPKVRSHSS